MIYRPLLRTYQWGSGVVLNSFLANLGETSKDGYYFVNDGLKKLLDELSELNQFTSLRSPYESFEFIKLIRAPIM